MQAEMLDYHSRGLPVLDISHRSADIAVANFRQMPDIPEGYSVLFMQGGASARFSFDALVDYLNLFAEQHA